MATKGDNVAVRHIGGLLRKSAISEARKTWARGPGRIATAIFKKGLPWNQKKGLREPLLVVKRERKEAEGWHPLPSLTSPTCGGTF